MSCHSTKNPMALIHYARALGWAIAVWFVCASCSGSAKKARSGNQASPAASDQASTSPSSPGPSPTVAALRTPETVASGKVTESRGTWNSMVQRIMYVSSADNTRQPMMFYKPNLNEPRPLVVALHSWSEGYRQSESVIYSEWAIANDWVFVIGQSLRAFNLLAEPQDNFTDEEIEYFTRQSQVPSSLRSETTDPDYGGLKILYRRQSGNVRITVFDGAHDKNTEAAFRWLNKQRK
jgi:hypothetical protein